MIASDLARLREKDPTTWEKFNSTVAIYEGYEEIYQDGLTDRARLAWLQAVLQDAIQARGWLLKLSTFSAQPSACIWKPEDAIYVARRYYGAGESLAEALLKAYLEAIR